MESFACSLSCRQDVLYKTDYLNQPICFFEVQGLDLYTVQCNGNFHMTMCEILKFLNKTTHFKILFLSIYM